MGNLFPISPPPLRPIARAASKSDVVCRPCRLSSGGDFAAGPNVPEEDLDNENFVANEQVRVLAVMVINATGPVASELPCNHVV